MTYANKIAKIFLKHTLTWIFYASKTYPYMYKHTFKTYPTMPKGRGYRIERHHRCLNRFTDSPVNRFTKKTHLPRKSAFFHAPTCPILGQKTKNRYFFQKKMKVIVNLRSPLSFFICIFAAENTKTDSPTHRLTDSPTHRLTNSPINRFTD